MYLTFSHGWTLICGKLRLSLTMMVKDDSGTKATQFSFVGNSHAIAHGQKSVDNSGVGGELASPLPPSGSGGLNSDHQP